MLDVKVDGMESLANRLNQMRFAIYHAKRVDIGQTLSDWQTDDVHRKRPFTMRARRAGRATTIFRPHSRYEMKRHYAAMRRARRHGKVFLHWSTRAILREEMLKMLEGRMSQLLDRLKTQLWAINVWGAGGEATPGASDNAGDNTSDASTSI